MSKQRVIIKGLMASPEPFRLIKWSKDDHWNPTLQDINRGTYDYVRLHRLSGTLDIGLPDGHSLAITFDGSFILPAIPKFLELTSCVDVFNSFFGRLLLGGVYTKAVDATYIQNCVVQEDYYVRTYGQALNAFVGMKDKLRRTHAATLDNIILHETNFILLRDLYDAYEKGTTYFDTIKNLTPSIVCKGVSAYINNSYSESLLYNWLSIEQVLDHIWNEHMIKEESKAQIKGRKTFLQDTRSWTIATKVELFYQKSLLNKDLYNQLNTIRKARNKFVHTGAIPSKEEAGIAFRTGFELISLVASNFKETTIFNELLIKYNGIDPIQREFYEKRELGPLSGVKFWYNHPIPNIPGDEKWNSNLYQYDTGWNFTTGTDEA